MRGRSLHIAGWMVALLLCVQTLAWADGTPLGGKPPARVPAAVAPPATADTPEPPPAPLANSEQPTVSAVDARLPMSVLLQLASTAFKDAQFDQAVAYLDAAYARKKLPALLFNIAQAYRKAGHAREAIEVYERFLQDNPSSPLAPEASAHSEALHAKLVAERATEARAEAEALARQRAAQAELTAELHAKERNAAEEALRKEIARREQPLYKRKWFWGLVGGLVGAAAISAVSLGIGLRPPPEPTGSLATQEVRF